MVIDIFGRSRKRKQQDAGGGEVVTGPRGLAGPRGLDGAGFVLNKDGHYDMQSKRLVNLKDCQDNQDAVTLNDINNRCLTRTDEGDFDVGNKRIKHCADPLSENDCVNKKFITDRIRFDKSYYSFNKKRLVSVADPRDAADVVTLNYLNTHALVPNSEGNFDAKEYRIVKVGPPKSGSNDAVPCTYMEKNAMIQHGDAFDAKNNRIKNLARPRLNGDAVSLEYVRDKNMCLESETDENGKVDYFWEASGMRIKNVQQPKTDEDAVNYETLQEAIRVALKRFAVRARHELAGLAIDFQRQFYNLRDTAKDKRTLAAHLNTIEGSIDRNWRAVNQIPPAVIKHSKEEINKAEIKTTEFIDEN